MTQNSLPKAKLEDVTNVTGRPSFPISKTIINIGSSLENDLVIAENTVSDRHAAIEQQPDGQFVITRSSSATTLVNGTELEPNSPRRLNDGDEISIDTFAFIFKLEALEQSQAAASPSSTIILDSSMLIDDSQRADSAEPAPDTGAEPGDDELVHLDSDALMEELFAFDNARPEPEPEPESAPEPEAEAAPEPETEADTDPDHNETDSFDSSSLMDELFADEPAQPEPEPDTEAATDPGLEVEAETDPGLEVEAETDPGLEVEAETDPGLEVEAETDPGLEVEAETDPGLEVEAETDPDHDETVFFDSSSLMEELFTEEPAKPEPDPDTVTDTDPGPEVEAETDPDHDETVFFDSGSLMEELNGAGPSQPEPARGETAAGKEPAAPSEVTKIGNYEVLKLLGKGGFGSVWKAQTPDGQPVAIKVLNPEVVEDERAVRKFYHEAINLSKMDHPNICRFIDFFPHEGNPAIIMDFVEGTNLQDMLQDQKGPLPFDTARQIASQALDGLHYAHQKQVLHRDIKPENITLTTEGVAKIMDFGIASLSSTESQQTSLFMISPAYTAPERFDASKTDLVDHRADIYALGLVFYELFAGKHPFPTDKPMEMIMAHINEVPTSPDEIEDLPKEISDAILKALEKAPEDRFEDFAAFKMEMLGEAPLRSSDTIGPIEFAGDSCKNSAALLKTLTGLVKKHQKQAQKITVGQVGNQVNLIIETIGGNVLSITRDIE